MELAAVMAESVPAMKSGVIAVIGALCLITGGCFDWAKDVTVHGVSFARVRTEPNGIVIGELKNDSRIGGRLCRQGWVHLHPNGNPKGFTAAEEIEAGKLKIPPGTWVFQDADGVVTVCSFPRDTEIQGHLCRGTGGPKGTQASFYPSGALKQYYPPTSEVVEGVTCRPSSLNGWIELHEDGRLKSCLLERDLTRDSHTWREGTRIRIDAAGRITAE
jgi:hypothetical protein